MYAERIQLTNYGPIPQLDIAFPFQNAAPAPVIIVGENGSGKTLLLSHIVNGVIAAKDLIYPETPEVALNKVYKLRSNTYIGPRADYYFGRVDFQGGFFASEFRSRRDKQAYDDIPTGISGTIVESAWQGLASTANDHYDSNLTESRIDELKELFTARCVLFFPFNRFEEPAWLNEENLNAQANYMALTRLSKQTTRKIISYSPLHENQDWLFGVVYDRATLDIQTRPLTLPGPVPLPINVFSGYSGEASKTYDLALRILRVITRREHARFGIGNRNNRVVTVESEIGQLAPNIFHLSSGETCLLNLFLSLLRDFDLSGGSLSGDDPIRGLVVVDEIDLHLHAVHQYEVLPTLLRMFPGVQFLVTTHSPLFVLGMRELFGEEGFRLYRMPTGQRISPEEFSEFGDAYHLFTTTRTFAEHIRSAIEEAQKPLLLLEGATDQRYLQRASQLLGKETTLESFNIYDGGGSGNLVNMWKDFKYPLTDIMPQKVLLLFDCDKQRANENKGNLFQRTVPMHCDNPIQKGIENLFRRPIFKRARVYAPEFIDIAGEQVLEERGIESVNPERWSVNKDEKARLCDWLCENGTQEDFEEFRVVFELLDEVLASHP